MQGAKNDKLPVPVIISTTLLTNRLNECNKTDLSFKSLINALQTNIDDTCMLNTNKLSKRNRVNNPWITSGIINSISKRDRIYKKWKKTTTKLCKSGDPRLFEEYRRYRSRLSKLIKMSKQRYYNLKFENATGNYRQTWALINELRGKSKDALPSHFTININRSHIDNKYVIGIFIDLSKAFDTIDHKILLKKLYNYGVRDSAHNLIGSYLSNRYQSVKIDNEISCNLLVKYGVPQGSVLGPLLFLIYINDIINSVKSDNCEFILYADDTNIFIACKTLEKAAELGNEILAKVEEYMTSNLLHINLDKCCFMYFPPKNKFLTQGCDKNMLNNRKNKKSRAIKIMQPNAV